VVRYLKEKLPMPFPKGRPRPAETVSPHFRLTRMARDLRWVADNQLDVEAPCYSAERLQELLRKRPATFWKLYWKYADEEKP
jgi:hypothetical protein